MTVVFSPMGQLDVTVARQVATMVYGRFQVLVPDGAEATRDDRYEDGFVYRPNKRPQGRFDLGFVRADVTIDMNTQISDLEMVVDAAQTRSEGAMFVQQDLSGHGLSGYVPGVDFDIGDLVGLRVFENAGPLEMPVTALQKTSDAESWSARVGGSQVDDAVARRKHNSEILRAVDAERRRAAEAREAMRREAEERKKFESYVKTDFKFDVNQYAEAQSDAARKAAQAYADAALNKKPWQEQVDDALAAARRAQSTATDANSYAYRLNSDRVAQINQLSDNVQKSLWSQQAKIDAAQNKATQANTEATRANSKAIAIQRDVTDQIKRQWTRFWSFDNGMYSGRIGGRKVVDFGVDGGNFRITAAPGYPMDYGVICHVEAISNHTVYYDGSLSGGETMVHSSLAFQAIKRGLLILQPRW